MRSQHIFSKGKVTKKWFFFIWHPNHVLRVKSQCVWTPSCFDIDLTLCFKGCRNGCEAVLIVSSRWTIISLSARHGLGLQPAGEGVNTELCCSAHWTPPCTAVHPRSVINQALELRHLLPPAPQSILLRGKLTLYAINTHILTHNIPWKTHFLKNPNIVP